jgi:mycothiol synthase
VSGPLPTGAGVAVRGVLAPAEADEVLALVARAARVDGGEPVSEDARLALRSAGGAGLRHLLLREGASLVGYAQVGAREPCGGGAGSPAGATAELLVDPAARGRGHGTLLAAAVEATAADAAPGPLSAWSHADSPAAAALAARRGYARVRELWRMARPLGAGAPPLPALELPDDVQLRPFQPGQDEEAWLAVNARAFATHPEQGRWTAADLAAREAEPWFDSAGFLLAVQAQDGHLLAFHWTKVEEAQDGEVYVVGVDPSAQGRGLGTVVTLAGLHHLELRGVRHVELYVEGDNRAAQRVYTRLGFERSGTDVLYRRR